MSDLNDRVCIIGGGPAGLAAGMYLEQKGYRNYAILEKSDHVGGKCNSPAYNGRRYEMGAIMGVPSYYAIADIERFCGVTHDGPKLNRNFKDLKGNVVDPFDAHGDPKLEAMLAEGKRQIEAFGTILSTKYLGYDVNGHRGVAEGRFDGYAVTPGRERVSGTNPNLKDLALPFAEFCKINGVPLVQQAWIGPFTSFGYGYFDEIPAAYVLKYLDFQTCMNFLKVNLWTWKDGTQHIFEELNDKLLHSARLNSDISKIERRDGKVFVTVNGTVEEYDKIIVTSPLQYLPDYFDATEDERELFGKISYKAYDVLAVETAPEDHPEISYYVLENMVPQRLGHLMVYYNRWRDDVNHPITTYAIRNHKDMADIPYNQCKEMVLEDLKSLGNPASKVINEQSWYYFPHVDSETYASGWYDKVEAMQGQKGTYYAGEVMSFGDMDETCEYSRELIDRFF
ncbi:MAG: FAD-dependent oxidoreductase [Eggerthellaceae bacterium]|jgi:hypothetical protein